MGEKERFFNACMLLMNIDMQELVDAGIIREGNRDNGGISWKRFNDEPLIFLAKLNDQKRDALWKLLEARQPVKEQQSVDGKIVAVGRQDDALVVHFVIDGAPPSSPISVAWGSAAKLTLHEAEGR